MWAAGVMGADRPSPRVLVLPILITPHQAHTGSNTPLLPAWAGLDYIYPAPHIVLMQELLQILWLQPGDRRPDLALVRGAAVEPVWCAVCIRVQVWAAGCSAGGHHPGRTAPPTTNTTITTPPSQLTLSSNL